jgi:hypothetical protein
MDLDRTFGGTQLLCDPLAAAAPQQLAQHDLLARREHGRGEALRGGVDLAPAGRSSQDLL